MKIAAVSEDGVAILLKPGGGGQSGLPLTRTDWYG
jgi:hypothetical protein